MIQSLLDLVLLENTCWVFNQPIVQSEKRRNLMTTLENKTWLRSCTRFLQLQHIFGAFDKYKSINGRSDGRITWSQACLTKSSSLNQRISKSSHSLICFASNGIRRAGKVEAPSYREDQPGTQQPANKHPTRRRGSRAHLTWDHIPKET